MKLADFGLARNINSEMTKLTFGVGTFDYMAPEALNRKPSPFKSDIYSLGLILHYMLARNFPDLKDNVKTGIFSIPTEYSDDIVALLPKLLKKNPEDRTELKDLFSS